MHLLLQPMHLHTLLVLKKLPIDLAFCAYFVGEIHFGKVLGSAICPLIRDSHKSCDELHKYAIEKSPGA